MSEFTYHLSPATPGVEIRDFRVTGLPDPADGSDAVPLRWLEDSEAGTRPRVVRLSLIPAATEDYALVAWPESAGPFLADVWVPSQTGGARWTTAVQTVMVGPDRKIKVSFRKGLIVGGQCDLVISGGL
jgi:hypothetical protein